MLSQSLNASASPVIVLSSVTALASVRNARLGNTRFGRGAMHIHKR